MSYFVLCTNFDRLRLSSKQVPDLTTPVYIAGATDITAASDYLPGQCGESAARRTARPKPRIPRSAGINGLRSRIKRQIAAGAKAKPAVGASFRIDLRIKVTLEIGAHVDRSDRAARGTCAATAARFFPDSGDVVYILHLVGIIRCLSRMACAILTIGGPMNLLSLRATPLPSRSASSASASISSAQATSSSPGE